MNQKHTLFILLSLFGYTGIAQPTFKNPDKKVDISVAGDKIIADAPMTAEIAEFNIKWHVQGGETAKASGGVVQSMSVIIDLQDQDFMQQMTDAIYANFKKKLTAAGYSLSEKSYDHYPTLKKWAKELEGAKKDEDKPAVNRGGVVYDPKDNYVSGGAWITRPSSLQWIYWPGGDVGAATLSSAIAMASMKDPNFQQKVPEFKVNLVVRHVDFKTGLAAGGGMGTAAVKYELELALEGTVSESQMNDKMKTGYITISPNKLYYEGIDWVDASSAEDFSLLGSGKNVTTVALNTDNYKNAVIALFDEAITASVDGLTNKMGELKSK